VGSQSNIPLKSPPPKQSQQPPTLNDGSTEANLKTVKENGMANPAVENMMDKLMYHTAVGETQSPL
jgi:hypothetical protein